ncbi:MAG: TspB protein [Circular genetic element sp.]|nr:MAG: TspB protein [Circular genetic element sp.]
MITRFQYEDLERNKQAERVAFGMLTGFTPEVYMQKSSAAGTISKNVAKSIAKKATKEAIVGSAVWAANRSRYLAPRVAARAVPYVGAALLIYDLYTIYDKFA